MEEKDEFSDIMLERDSENKASKLKKIVLVVSFFVLLFVIVLVVMKFVYKSDNSSDSRIVLPPEKKLIEVKQKAKEDPLFKQVPIIEEDNKKESFEEMVKKLKEKESIRAKEDKDKKVNTNVSKDDLKPVEMKVKPVPIKEVKIIKKPKTEAKKPKVEKKVEVKKPKKEEKTKINFKPSKPIPTIPSPSATGKTKGIYIQVLATSKNNPDNKFVEKVKAKNYSYKPYETTVKGKKYIKILVGPYGSRKEANNALPKVRKDLNPKAFVFSIR